MAHFTADIIAMHAPTGQLQSYREDFDTLAQAISKPCWFLQQLRSDVGDQLQCNSWANLGWQSGDEDEDGNRQIFWCNFMIGGAAGISGMVLVTALHQEVDG